MVFFGDQQTKFWMAYKRANYWTTSVYHRMVPNHIVWCWGWQFYYILVAPLGNNFVEQLLKHLIRWQLFITFLRKLLKHVVWQLPNHLIGPIVPVIYRLEISVIKSNHKPMPNHSIWCQWCQFYKSFYRPI